MVGLGNMDDVYKHYLKVIEENKGLEKKLEIAVQALEEYANEDNWCDCIAGFYPNPVDSGCYGCYGFQEAQEALAKIKEIK